ncbi:MAG: ATP-dependent helicase HrpB, partial [Gemmatimonadetes bacterium]|nr:ATP-dependent helicase HrpB [Gemmatimonadota bacterium]NIT88262.1 ATP-dependent helicase HrpB [Gemmatimonadota bacterium]NIU73333.1 ATP-dependent helicase HrpB [Gammaproteobacteria bacterium]NIY07767.1 ATP-dependent helicase HrpB [Gemmatimonadota bacterium]NIY40285.1 ATP-dependent helicase HrpB [Gemmatimonadota bacterium]
SLAQAAELLRELEALDVDGAVTAHGREMAGVGVHPRLAHMLLRGREMGLGGLACDLAALLGDRDILDAPDRAPDADLRLRVEAMRRSRSGARTPVDTVRGQRVRPGALRRTLREAEHLRRLCGVDGGRSPAGDSEHTGIVLAFAYPDRIGRRREGERGRFLLRNGKGARFAEAQALAGSDWIVAADLDARGRDARIFRAAPLDEE